MANITPNHNGSAPIAIKIGPTIGTTIKVISMKSKINPRIKTNSITKTIEPNNPPGILLKISVMSSSPPKPLKTREKIDAPIRIKKTIDEIKALCFVVSERIFRFNFLWSKAINIAPRAPIPAASVGEATPKIIDPKTAKIRKKGGASAVSYTHLRAHET